MNQRLGISIGTIALALALSVPSVARAQCTACTYPPPGNCVLIQSNGYLNCSVATGSCVTSGDCKATELDTKFDVMADGSVRVRSQVSALLVSWPIKGTTSTGMSALHRSVLNGASFIRGCGGAVIERHYTAAAADRRRHETKSVVI